MNNLPLFLENEAYLVWDELSSTDKADPDAVKATLKSAFSTTPAASFQKFRARTLRTDESVEGYAADLKKLLFGAGQKVASDGKDCVVIEQFVAGLAWEFHRKLRINCSMEYLTVLSMSVACGARRVRRVRKSRLALRLLAPNAAGMFYVFVVIRLDIFPAIVPQTGVLAAAEVMAMVVGGQL